MILKLGMEHYVLKLYKVYINYDPELTLTYFKTMSNLATYLAQILDERLQDHWSSGLIFMRGVNHVLDMSSSNIILNGLVILTQQIGSKSKCTSNCHLTLKLIKRER